LPQGVPGKNLLTSHGSDNSGLHRPDEVFRVLVLESSVLKLSLVQIFLPRLGNDRDPFERLVTVCIRIPENAPEPAYLSAPGITRQDCS